MVQRKKPRLASFLPSISCRAPILDDGGGGSVIRGEDRLTGLPDTIRLHILSLLPLKSAIRASSLSTKWRGLWRYRWPQLGDIRLAPSSSSSSPADFVASVDSTLIGRDLNCRIDAIAISLPPGRRYDDELKRWLGHAAACGVVDVSVELLALVPPLSCVRSKRAHRRTAASSIAFQSICDCRDLVRLAISGVRIQPPRSSCFSLLEVLVLHDSQIASSVLKSLILYCPRLWSLELKRCRKLRKISIPNDIHRRFASLTIVEGRGVSVISVCTLSLKRIMFSSNFLPFRLTDVDELKDVYMSAGCTEDHPQGNFVSNLGQLSDVKFLSLCDFSLQNIVVWATTAVELGIIKRFTELQLIMGMMTESNLSDIYSFFRLCDCDGLEKLFIKLPKNMRDPFLQKYLPAAEAETSPQIDFVNLRTIKITNFKGHKNEMKLLEFLLVNAGSLETLLVVAHRNLRMKGRSQNATFLRSIRLQLSLFRKASQDVEVILKEYDDHEFMPVHSLNLGD